MKAGIPTHYRGVRFRSRLEARWAAFFDLIGWRWVYEPYDRNGWIPDFLIHGDLPLLIEIKPAQSIAELVSLLEPSHYSYPARRGTTPLSHRGLPEVLLLGVGPQLHGKADCWGDPPAGLICDGDWFDGGRETFEDAHWARCADCKHVGVFNSVHSFAIRPCSHHEGDHLLGEWGGAGPSWAEACNVTQWVK